MTLPVEIQRKPLPNDRALRLLEEAGLMQAEEFYQTSDELRKLAFTLARVRNAAVLARVKRALGVAVEKGWTVADFIDWTETNGLIWERWYTEVVFRNAVQGAYSRARWIQLNRPHIQRAMPALMYDAIIDSRTSEVCFPLDGLVWLRSEFPQSLYPPNHHQCRSVVRAVTKAVLAGLDSDRRASGSPPGHPGADMGFGGNVATNWQAMAQRRLTILEKFIGVAA